MFALALVKPRQTGSKLRADAIAGSYDVDRPVVNQTGLNGKFDFTVEYTGKNLLGPPNADGTLAAPQGTPFLDALRELGLKLVPSKASVRVIVIDQVKRPSEN